MPTPITDGYLSPIDLFEGAVPAGALFLPTGDGLTHTANGTSFTVPSEIVEMWEQANEPEPEILSLGSPVINVTVSSEKASFDFSGTFAGQIVEVSIGNIQIAINNSKKEIYTDDVGPINFRIIPSIRDFGFLFGGSSASNFSVSELQQIVDSAQAQQNLTV